MFASYVALDLASRVVAANKKASLWLASAALSLGLGIWSVHFIGMLALQLPVPISYNLSLTLLSLLAAIFAAAFALYLVSGLELRWPRPLWAGIVLGLGIAAVLYFGVAAMQIHPPIKYDPWLFGLSIHIAIFASVVALWSIFHLRSEPRTPAVWKKIGGAMVMGAGIAGMHYIGMTAAIFSTSSASLATGLDVKEIWLAIGTGAISLILVTVALVAISENKLKRYLSEHLRSAQALRESHDELEFRVQRRTLELARANTALQAEVAQHEQTEAVLRASQEEAREIMDTAYDAYIAMDADSIIVEWNRQAERIFGFSRADALGKNLAETLVPLPYRQAHYQRIKRFLDTGVGPTINDRRELRALHRDGHEFPVEVSIWPTKMGGQYKFNVFLHDISERRRAMQRLTALTEASATLVESTTLEEAAPNVLREIGSALGWAVGVLWTLDKSANVLRCSAFWHDPNFSSTYFEAQSRTLTFTPGVGGPGRIWDSGKSLWIPDICSDQNFRRSISAGAEGLHGYFGFPITCGGKLYGIVEFFSTTSQEPHPELLQITDTVGNLFGQFLERIQTKSALEQEREFLAALLENLTDGIVACDEQGTLTLFNRATREFHGMGAEPLPPAAWSEHYHLYLADGKTPMPTDDIPLFRAFRGEVVRDVEMVVAPKDAPSRNLVCNGQALISASGKKLGAVVAMHDITERKQTEQKLVQLAHFDTLTTLPNRLLFFESLQKALLHADKHQCVVSVMFLDIDRFKDVNDTLGHAVGDELLRQVGSRLVQCLRVRDTVGRLGGDEFGIILITPSGPQGAQIVAAKIGAALQPPFEIHGQEVTVTASIGIAIYPDDGLDSDVLMRYADTAMYEAKAMGKDTFRFYKAEMNAHALQKLELENALRKALANNEFILHYQPKIQIDSGEWAGVEALLRWHRPGHGLVSPAAFIPLLEETGLIVPVGAWVISTACKQMADWRRAGAGLIRVAVNVSSKQFIEDGLITTATNAMREHRIGVGLLEMEITESSLMKDADRTHRMLKELNALGISIAIDDFGTGYSSLAYLSRFWIDKLKIDIAFIRNVTTNSDNAAITIAIIGMAHNLKLSVVAEGVETLEQLEFLRAHHCDEIQGYLLSKPLPPTEVMMRISEPFVFPSIYAADSKPTSAWKKN